LFVYLAALESGYTPDSTVIDSPLTIAGWSPRNDSGRYSGNVTLRQALAYSINTVAVRLAQDVGTGSVADMAQRMGITTRVATNPSMALGTSEVRLLDMTRAYASVAAGGTAVVPYGIRRVTTADGTLLYQHPNEQGRVLVAPHVAAQMTDLLQGVVLHGTGRNANLGRPTAGKTGTTTSNKDGWFLGFSSGLTTGVWMGRDDNRAVAGLAGGRAPAQAFHDFMIRAVSNRPVENLNTAVASPDWQAERDGNSVWDDLTVPEPLVDPDGMPLGPEEPVPPPEDEQPGVIIDRPRDSKPEDDSRIDREWLERSLDRRPPAPRRDPLPPREREREREVVKPEE
jgi:penicillin-binding protein 1A